MAAWLYILRCADGSYYTGTTRDSLEARVARHNAGHFGGYTAKRRPVTLVFSESFPQILDAIAAERQVKGWSRAKKEALMAGDFDLLKDLANAKPDPARPIIEPTQHPKPHPEEPPKAASRRMVRFSETRHAWVEIKVWR